ncbi:hypothetical protein [Deinococcus murrayi]|uniref:hypothetical protein n=1 Tax=Deinococcus murrayi TaxID=68910 RepID=UPI00048360F0|nr:hypothetical protein [Deinococcus murrayi]
METGDAQRFQEAAQDNLQVVPMLLAGTGGEHGRIKLSSTVIFPFHTLILREEAVLDVLF